MGKSFIVVSSITYAMKAKQLLGNYGIKSKVIRTPKHNQNQSCTYSLFIPKKTDEAERILKENGIKIIERTEGS